MDDGPATGVTGSISLRGSTGLDSGVMKLAEDTVGASPLQQREDEGNMLGWWVHTSHR